MDIDIFELCFEGAKNVWEAEKDLPITVYVPGFHEVKEE